MHTAEWRSSNGLSCGPAVQAASRTHQPEPDANVRTSIVIAGSIAIFPKRPQQTIVYWTPRNTRRFAAMTATFIDALRAGGPAPDRADQMGLYAWLIGSWTMEAVVHADDGTTHRGCGEVHAGWVLEGRAIQDVWILPGVFYGTTLRIYDPGLAAWHILWSDPLRQYYGRQLGRAVAKQIVQDGTNDAGEKTRWSFSDIKPDSFLWRGERSRDGGATWQLQAEFSVRRAGP